MSLKTSMALAVSLLFVIVMTGLSWFAVYYFEQTEKQSILKQQRVLAEQAASCLDDKFALIRRSFKTAALDAADEKVDQPAAARHFLDGKSTLLNFCNAGLFLLDTKGCALAYTPTRPILPENFRQILQQLQSGHDPVMSEAFTSSALPGQPLVVFFVPVAGCDGQTIAILGGTVNLLSRSIFNNLAGLRIGNSGYLYLFDGNRTLIVHPDRRRIMQRDIPVGANRLFDAALSGRDVSGETVNSRGVALISTFHHLQTEDWIIAVNYPQAEAYASIRRGKVYFIAVTIMATLLVLASVRFMMWRLTRPLVEMTSLVAEMDGRTRKENFLPESGGREIRTLARAFNALLQELESRRKRLEELNADLEARVAQRTRLLEDANRELEAFSYSLTHDLRNPLHIIAGFADVLSERYGDRLDSDGRDYLNRIISGSDRMEELIEAMLTLAQISRQPLLREDVDLTALAAEIVESLRASDPQRRIDVQIDPGLTACGDPRLLRVMLENLLGNAWKYTEKTARPVIGLTGRAADNEMTFSLRDNGAGFEMARAAEIFLPFRRLHTEQSFHGHGIGLATVKKIVERHGGRIWAEGEPGNGACFHFTLPESCHDTDVT